MCMWVSLDPPPSHVMGFQVVVLPPCFARPPQLVVRCGARTCIDGIVARFSAHGFLICCYCESLQSHMEGCCGRHVWNKIVGMMLVEFERIGE